MTEQKVQRSPAPLLNFEDVSIIYEESEHPTIQHINFSLDEGEAVLFLGPSGCGKSTLAMLCAHLIPHSVEATVDGKAWYSPQIEQPGQVGYVFQDPDSQFCMLTVADEIAFGLENQAFPATAIDDRSRHALNAAGLPVPLAANHAEFSGGMKQKLAIASALALQPNLLVLDEPTANLDPFSTRQVFEQITRLHEAGQAMIVIEHKFDPLLPVMDRVILFDRTGRIYRAGPTLQVICDEWAWLVDTGVVASWKTPPVGCQQMISGDSEEIATPPGRMLQASDHNAFLLQQVSLSYGKQRVLHDLSLRIPKGDFVAVVGPNGAGKSSFLQLLAGLKRPASGSLTLLDRPIGKWKVRERFSAIAYSFQNPEFQFIYERVGDELANRIVGADVPAQIHELLAQFGLDDLDQHSPFSLSQGQKRRLSVASMMRKTHEIYLFDEPTFGQDAKTQAAIMERMKALNEAGKTIIITTHDMDLVRRYAHHVIVIASGAVIFQGASEDLFSQKDILRVAHLLDDTMAELPQIQDSSQHLEGPKNVRKSLVARLHPGWLFLAMFMASLISLFAHTLPEAIAEMALPLVVMMGLGWMSPWKIAKLLSPFLVFYVLYLWSYVANAAVPTGTTTLNFLWYHLSYYGLDQGLILSIRMLGSVLFGILFVTQIDFTDFMVALTKDFHVPPKFAYGTMAGLRVVPLFASEWTKLRQARQIRGKEGGSAWLNPVTYALPLLSQGIRMSERVAIAMEARGFHGKVSTSATHRTFYRLVKVHAWDLIVSAAIVILAVLGVIV